MDNFETIIQYAKTYSDPPERIRPSARGILVENGKILGGYYHLVDPETHFDDFNIYLLEYYLGIIEGLEVVLEELKTHIPNTHFNIMPLVTPQLMSRIMTKYLTKMNAERVKPHFHANELYNKIHNPDSLITGFLMNLTEA